MLNLCVRFYLTRSIQHGPRITVHQRSLHQRIEKPRHCISMDGKGAWKDNVFVERLWRSVKYEEVYLNAYESASEAKQSLAKYFHFYNKNRKHQTLMATPDQVYYESVGCKKQVVMSGNNS